MDNKELMNDPKITSLLEQLLVNCQSINSVLASSDCNSTLDKVSQEITAQLAVLIKDKKQGDTISKDIDSLLPRINDLCESIIKEKAQNPLISNELITLATQTKSNATEAISLRNLATDNESARPKFWYHLFRRLLRQLIGRS